MGETGTPVQGITCVVFQHDPSNLMEKAIGESFTGREISGEINPL